MNTSVEKISPTQIKLTITLDKDQLAAAEQVALSKLAKKVKVQGFRQGKAPLSAAKKAINPELLAEQTLEDALSKAVAESFLEQKLQALNRPEVEIKKFVPGQELEFTAETEIMPEIKLGDYKKLTAKKESKKVMKKDIDEVIERIASGMSEKKPVERAAKNGDEVVIDFVGKKDGEAFAGGEAKDYGLALGSNTFIPGFEDGLVGSKAGDKKDLKVTFPSDYHEKSLAGKDVVFETTVKSVNEIVVPKHDDEFAKKAGPFETFKEFEADIKRELEARAEQDADNKHKDALVAELIEKSEVPVPQVLIDDQVRSIEQDMMQNLMYQGLTLDQYFAGQGYKDREDWVKKEVEPAAKKRVQAGLVLAELSKVEKIEATADELADHLNLYRDQYKNSPEMAKRFEEPEVQRDVANRLITEKTVDRLVEVNAGKKPAAKKADKPDKK